jgi:hypothetical protein
MEINSKLLLEMIEQEIEQRNKEPRKEPNDHEGRMAKSELRDMIKNGLALYKIIGEDDELPGWASSYISLASDYIHSVSQYMIEEQAGSEDEED